MNKKNKQSSRYKAITDEQKIVLFNKPFQVLCQFTDESEKKRKTLADYIGIKDVYAAGRLDFDSEGLLVLTNDGRLQARIANPLYKKPKTYFVQVEGLVSQDMLNQLKKGVQLKDGLTRPATAEHVDEPGWLWERTPAIRERKSIPTAWIKLTITEGKNRQVRRMTAAVGIPTLRLIRYSVGDWSIENIPNGKFIQIEKQRV